MIINNVHLLMNIRDNLFINFLFAIEEVCEVWTFL
jgi:hypothetical protein